MRKGKDKLAAKSAVVRKADFFTEKEYGDFKNDVSQGDSRYDARKKRWLFFPPKKMSPDKVKDKADRLTEVIDRTGYARLGDEKVASMWRRLAEEKAKRR